MLTRVSVFSSLAGLLLFGLAGTTSVVAQVGTVAAPTTNTPALTTPTSTSPASLPTSTQVVEWDVSSTYNGDGTCVGFCVDAQPGAVDADNRGENSALWFVTRAGDFRVLRLQPSSSTKSRGAQWTSWQLDSSGITTGGIKRLKTSGGLAIVRTVNSVQIVDTNNCWNTTDTSTIPATIQTVCKRTEYQDTNAAMISDVAVDQNHTVYTAIAFAGSDGVTVDPSSSQIERLDPRTGNLLLWNVGGGAGNCVSQGVNNPCLAGIAVHPSNSNLVYYSEPDSDNIGELNICNNTVRRWSLAQAFAADSQNNPLVYQPRQLRVDQDGIVWVVTGSGHLVSLDPKKNLLTSHILPDGSSADPFGVAPDGGFVGYTASDTNKVGMLIPSGASVRESPAVTYISPICASAAILSGQAVQNCGSAPTYVKTVAVQVTQQPNHDTYVEAVINSNSTTNGVSMLPLGISPHSGKAVGTFFYAVGAATSTQVTVDRVGFVRLPRAGLKAKHEREDKDCDDDGSGHDDQDHDGIQNQNETSDSYAHMDRQNDQIAPGQSSTYVLTAQPTTKALVAMVTADNPLAPVSVEIDDPNGIVLALPVATPGTAVATAVPTVPGNYTVRITNASATTITPETDLLAREGLLP